MNDERFCSITDNEGGPRKSNLLVLHSIEKSLKRKPASVSERGGIVYFKFIVRLTPTIGNASWDKKNTPLSI